MSINVGYFFNSDKPFGDLTKEINGWLGCSLAPYEADEKDLFCIFLGMELSFGIHDFENDLDLNFEDYKYEIDVRTPAGNAFLRDIQISAVAFIAKVLYEKMKITGMMVYDLQQLLARYEERVDPQNQWKALFDLVSNKFVNFPQHSFDLDNLVKDYWKK